MNEPNSVRGTQPTTAQQCLGIKEFMARTGLSRPTVVQMLKRKELPAVKVGRLVKLPVEAVEQWESTRPPYEMKW